MGVSNPDVRNHQKPMEKFRARKTMFMKARPVQLFTFLEQCFRLVPVRYVSGSSPLRLREPGRSLILDTPAS